MHARPDRHREHHDRRRPLTKYVVSSTLEDPVREQTTVLRGPLEEEMPVAAPACSKTRPVSHASRVESRAFRSGVVLLRYRVT
jgi:hypothetical protein